MGSMVLPKLLLIAGTGRDTGKTSLACTVIERFKNTGSLVAFKISPHRHKLIAGGNVIVNEDNLYVSEEKDPGTGKDSSRMLAAGAGRSFFAVATDEELLRAWDVIQDHAGRDAFFIGESGGLRRYVEPGLFFMVSHLSTQKKKPDPYHLHDLADMFVTYDGKSLLFDPDRIILNEQGWKIRKS
jgi:hypothetical protein